MSYDRAQQAEQEALERTDLAFVYLDRAVRCIKDPDNPEPDSPEVRITYIRYPYNQIVGVGCEIKDFGNTYTSSNVAEYGVCYGTSQSPTYDNAKQIPQHQFGDVFESTIVLSSTLNQTYYFRAYIIMDDGRKFYSNQVSNLVFWNNYIGINGGGQTYQK